MSKLIIGCGYLGQRVAALWRGAGHEVFATTRARTDMLHTLGLTPIVCDVTRPETLRALPQVQTVCYAVGLDRSAGQSMREVYVAGLEQVLQALPKPERFLYVSSTSVYGQRDGEAVDEDAATEPEEESGQIVLAAEATLRQHIPEAIILRFAGIYGPGRLLRQRALQTGEPIAAAPERWLNLIHVDDGAAAVLAAEQHGTPGATCNIADDCPVRRQEFYERLAARLGAPPPRFSAPGEGAPHERAHRRIVNRRMREELHVALRYPSYREGLEALA